jgi:hypothetical protein
LPVLSTQGVTKSMGVLGSPGQTFEQSLAPEPKVMVREPVLGLGTGENGLIGF